MRKVTQRFRDWACGARWKARVAVCVALLIGVPFTFAEYTFLALVAPWRSWWEDLNPVLKDAWQVLKTGRLLG